MKTSWYVERQPPRGKVISALRHLGKGLGGGQGSHVVNQPNLWVKNTLFVSGIGGDSLFSLKYAISEICLGWLHVQPNSHELNTGYRVYADDGD